MIEESLLNYGVFGLWTIFNIGIIIYYQNKEKKYDEKFAEVIENNTRALATFCEIARACQNRKV